MHFLWLRRGKPHCPHTLPSALLFTRFPSFCCSNRCVITPRSCYNFQLFNCQLGLAFFLPWCLRGVSWHGNHLWIRASASLLLNCRAPGTRSPACPIKVCRMESVFGRHSPTSHGSPEGRLHQSPCSSDEGTEAQRGEVVCPVCRSSWATEPGGDARTVRHLCFASFSGHLGPFLCAADKERGMS